MLPGTTLSIPCACCDSLRIPSLVFSLSRLRFSDAAENSHVLIALHLGTLICLSFEHTIAQEKHVHTHHTLSYVFPVLCRCEDMLESPAVVGLGFVHFALSRQSQEAQAIMAGRRTDSDLMNVAF